MENLPHIQYEILREKWSKEAESWVTDFEYELWVSVNAVMKWLLLCLFICLCSVLMGVASIVLGGIELWMTVGMSVLVLCLASLIAFIAMTVKIKNKQHNIAYYHVKNCREMVRSWFEEAGKSSIYRIPKGEITNLFLEFFVCGDKKQNYPLFNKEVSVIILMQFIESVVSRSSFMVIPEDNGLLRFNVESNQYAYSTPSGIERNPSIGLVSDVWDYVSEEGGCVDFVDFSSAVKRAMV